MVTVRRATTGYDDYNGNGWRRKMTMSTALRGTKLTMATKNDDNYGNGRWWQHKKSHAGHSVRMKTWGDMFDLRLLNKKHLYLTECHFSFKIHTQFF
jgi:hypothetical protein